MGIKYRMTFFLVLVAIFYPIWAGAVSPPTIINWGQVATNTRPTTLGGYGITDAPATGPAGPIGATGTAGVGNPLVTSSQVSSGTIPVNADIFTYNFGYAGALYGNGAGSSIQAFSAPSSDVSFALIKKTGGMGGAESVIGTATISASTKIAVFSNFPTTNFAVNDSFCIRSPANTYGIASVSMTMVFSASGITVPASGSLVTLNATYTYIYSGNSPYTIKIPANCATLSVKMWGAGGSSGTLYWGDPYVFGGGAGAFVSADIPVTANEQLNIYVGQAGIGSSSPVYGSGGGGLTGIQRNSNGEWLVIAGSGGGGGTLYNAINARGGAGGYPAGGDGQGNSSAGGHGGTQVSGGSPGAFPGNTVLPTGGGALTGGNGGIGYEAVGEAPCLTPFYQGGRGASMLYGTNLGCGGGGGSGWFGGGGGTADNSNNTAGGGGGGSSYALLSAINVTHTSGSGTTPGNSSDPDRGSCGANGQPGKVMVVYK